MCRIKGLDKIYSMPGRVFLMGLHSMVERDEVLKHGVIYFNRKPATLKPWCVDKTIKKEDIASFLVIKQAVRYEWKPIGCEKSAIFGHMTKKYRKDGRKRNKKDGLIRMPYTLLLKEPHKTVIEESREEVMEEVRETAPNAIKVTIETGDIKGYSKPTACNVQGQGPLDHG
ncbi:hypothetical protein Cgig2_008814 [Carnegiea gigantea]|uniref:Uncharacterized protein n=1 Tax=Carnegiea gigantea TaxID=171969 RepID=A0A9Q1GP09_9CARY|nr:hypothetical protein Cgig2_008814 [Carnegiea gigantea]